MPPAHPDGRLRVNSNPARPAAEPVTAQEVRTLREARGETQEQLAATLGVGVREVLAWEAGTLRVPPYEGAWIRHLLGGHAREQAAREAGILDCTWMTAQLDRADAEMERDSRADVLERLAKDVDAHAAVCPDCIRVREWVATQPPVPPPPPPRGLAGAVTGFMEWVQTLPAWLRPAVYGGTVFGGVTLIRAVLMIAVGGRTPEALGNALGATAVGTGMGIVGGLTWGMVHRPLRPLGKAAPYVSGMLVSGVACLLLLIVLPLLGEREASLADASGWTRLGIMMVLGGAILGFMLRNVDADG